MEVYKVTISFDGNRIIHQDYIISYLALFDHLFFSNDYIKERNRSFISCIMTNIPESFEPGLKTSMKHLNLKIAVEKYKLTDKEYIGRIH